MVWRVFARSEVAALVKRISAVPFFQPPEPLTAFLWCSITAVLLLPALSQAGYPVWAPEYVLVAVASVVAGLCCCMLSKSRWTGALLLVVMTFSAFTLYFGKMIFHSLEMFFLSCLISLSFITFSILNQSAALRVAGFSAFAQIVVTTVTGPGVVLAERDVPVKDIPSVFHLILDEHPGLAAFPSDAVSPQEMRQLENAYLSRGFTVFRRAYSAERSTILTFARLFNREAYVPPPNKEISGKNYLLDKADVLKEISKNRALDLTYTMYLDLSPGVDGIANVTRLSRIGFNHRGAALEFHRMTLSDRLWITAAVLKSWFIGTARSPLAVLFFNYTDAGTYWFHRLRPASRLSPLTARFMILDLKDRVQCCVKRGTYVLLHALYPHQPFIFDGNCELYPPSSWQLTYDDQRPDNLEQWKKFWRLAYEQTRCATRDVAQLADAVSQRAELADATVIVQGDHGSRLVIEDHAERAIAGYDQSDFEKDNRGTFFAVRIPGALEGRIVETPVRIDDIYRQLVEHDFRRLDLEVLKPRPDSPYAY